MSKIPCGHKIEGLAQEPQVVVRTVEDDFVTVQHLEKRGEVERGKRIKQRVVPFDADLHQAQFLWIGVQAVRLRVEGDPRGRPQPGQQRRQLRVRINHPCKIGKSGVPANPENDGPDLTLRESFPIVAHSPLRGSTFRSPSAAAW